MPWPPNDYVMLALKDEQHVEVCVGILCFTFAGLLSRGWM